MHTTFALLGIETGVGAIKGFALCYESAENALLFFEHVQRYLTTSAGDKQFQVEFTSNPPNCSVIMHMTIATESASFDCTISDLNLDDVQALAENLRNYKYYFILAGHVNAQSSFVLLPPENYHIFKADMWLDGERIVSATGGRWPPQNPFKARPAMRAPHLHTNS